MLEISLVRPETRGAGAQRGVPAPLSRTEETHSSRDRRDAPEHRKLRPLYAMLSGVKQTTASGAVLCKRDEQLDPESAWTLGRARAYGSVRPF